MVNGAGSITLNATSYLALEAGQKKPALQRRGNLCHKNWQTQQPAITVWISRNTSL